MTAFIIKVEATGDRSFYRQPRTFRKLQLGRRGCGYRLSGNRLIFSRISYLFGASSKIGHLDGLSLGRIRQILSFLNQSSNVSLLSSVSPSEGIGLARNTSHLLKLLPINNANAKSYAECNDLNPNKPFLAQPYFLHYLFGCFCVLCGGIAWWYGWYCLVSARLNWNTGESISVWLRCFIAAVLLFWHGFVLARNRDRYETRRPRSSEQVEKLSIRVFRTQV